MCYRIHRFSIHHLRHHHHHHYHHDGRAGEPVHGGARAIKFIAKAVTFTIITTITIMIMTAMQVNQYMVEHVLEVTSPLSASIAPQRQVGAIIVTVIIIIIIDIIININIKVNKNIIINEIIFMIMKVVI